MMKNKKHWISRVTVTVSALIALLMIIEFSIRLYLFSTWDEVFDDWIELVDEFEEDLPKERFPYPLEYYMHSVFEVYAVKQFRIIDDSGKYTEQMLYEQFQELVDSANRELDGNPTQIYIGRNPPDNITPKYFWAKPMNFISDLFSFDKKSGENVWHVIVYKRARGTFKL